MNMGVSKKERRVLREKESEYIKRRDVLMDGMKKLSKEHKIEIIPVLNFQSEGIRPMFSFVDVKDKVEEEAAVEKAKETKPKKPSLEV